jgi:hypothetical protein
VPCVKKKTEKYKAVMEGRLGESVIKGW